jgi:phage tail sheath gpL-like
MAIPFAEVPNGIRVPFAYVEFNSSNAQQGPSGLNYTALIIAQKNTAAAGAVNTITPINNVQDAINLWGAGSQIAQMVEAFKFSNSFTELKCIALADGAGAKATATITLTGTASANGLISMLVGGRAVSQAVTSGQTNTAIATALAATINASANLNVTAAAVSGVVTLTAKNSGIEGNYNKIYSNFYAGEATPAGITVAVSAFTGGVGSADIAAAITAMGDQWFQVIAHPYTDTANLDKIDAEANSRWSALRQIGGVWYTGSNVSHALLSTLGNGRNGKFTVIGHNYGSPTTPAEYAAERAGVVAFNAANDAARPFQTLPLAFTKAPRPQDRFTVGEKNILLYSGIATIAVDGGGVVRIEGDISTYKTNASSAPDTAYLYTNTTFILMYLQYDFRAYFGRKYPRHKLAGDNANFGAGQPVMTPKLGKAEALNLFRGWEELALVEDYKQFANAIIVERNISDPNRLDFYLAPNLVNGLRVIGAQIAFIL